MDKNNNYTIFGVEDLKIEIKTIQLSILALHTNYLKLVNENFGKFLEMEEFKIEIYLLLDKILQYILNGRKPNTTINLSVGTKLYFLMQQTKMDYNVIYKQIEFFFAQIILDMYSLKIFPKDLNQFNIETKKIMTELKLNVISDKKKIDEMHFKYLSTIRDEIFARNILEIINENNISKSIFVCGKAHMKPVANLIESNSEKFIGNKINIVMIDIT